MKMLKGVCIYICVNLHTYLWHSCIFDRNIPPKKIEIKRRNIWSLLPKYISQFNYNSITSLVIIFNKNDKIKKRKNVKNVKKVKNVKNVRTNFKNP